MKKSFVFAIFFLLLGSIVGLFSYKESPEETVVMHRDVLETNTENDVNEEPVELTKKYRNIKYRYRFLYPDGYAIYSMSDGNPFNVPIEEDVGVSLEGTSGVLASVFVFSKQNIPLREFAVQESAESMYSNTEITSKKLYQVSFAGIDAYQIDCIDRCTPINYSFVYFESPHGGIYRFYLGNDKFLSKKIMKTFAFD